MLCPHWRRHPPRHAAVGHFYTWLSSAIRTAVFSEQNTYVSYLENERWHEATLSGDIVLGDLATLLVLQLRQEGMKSFGEALLRLQNMF